MFWGKQDLSPRVKATQRSLVQKSRYYSGLVCDLMKGRGSPLGNIVVSLCEDCEMGKCCVGILGKSYLKEEGIKKNGELM